MNLKEDDTVSAIALVAESSQDIEDDEVVILAGPDGTAAAGPDDRGGDDADPAPAGETPPDDE
jgi:hypothetical protein